DFDALKTEQRRNSVEPVLKFCLREPSDNDDVAVLGRAHGLGEHESAMDEERGRTKCAFPVCQRAFGDIIVVRRFSETELQNGFDRIAALLRLEGIEIKKTKIQEIDIGTGKPVTRVKLEAMCGTLRGNTHIDINVAVGPDALPKGVVRQELPSMVRGEPGLVANVQPLAAAAAEKWFAVLMQEPTDYRVKHAGDLLSFSEMGVDPDLVAIEMLRISRHRGIPMSVCPPAPKALGWVPFMIRAEAWLKLGAERCIVVEPFAAHEMLSAYWSRTHQALTRAVIAEVRHPGYQTTLLDRIAARQQPSPAFRPTP
ncbi:nucleotidyl transferase AbiEii/AbiGii toxin family protein, partial [Agrobacterium tumefaciens]|uniref:nucleotidyl transferase AbiEii/AbiGii toxin family protein n=1 Tax=Agrobacterium tumefaciens TaxID=358 RepID=UPI00157439E3